MPSCRTWPITWIRRASRLLWSCSGTDLQVPFLNIVFQRGGDRTPSGLPLAGALPPAPQQREPPESYGSGKEALRNPASEGDAPSTLGPKELSGEVKCRVVRTRLTPPAKAGTPLLRKPQERGQHESPTLRSLLHPFRGEKGWG